MATPGDEGDPRSHPLEPSASQLVEEALVGRIEEPRRGGGRSRVQARLRGGERTLGPAPGVGGEGDGPLEEDPRRHHASPTLGTGRRGALELAGHHLVRSGCGVRAVPCPALGIETGVDGVGDRPVEGARLLRRRRPVHRGAHQRMAKVDAGAELHQSVGHRRRRCAEPGGPLRRRGAAGELEQGKRVSMGLGDDPVAHALVEPARGHRGQQLTGVSGGKSLEAQLGEALELRRRAGLADRDEHHHGLRVQPARRNRQRLGRCLVEPLGVLDDAQERLLLGDVGQKAEHGEADQEAIRRNARGQPEGGSQGVTLGRGQTVAPVEHVRSAEPVRPA